MTLPSNVPQEQPNLMKCARYYDSVCSEQADRVELVFEACGAAMFFYVKICHVSFHPRFSYLKSFFSSSSSKKKKH